MKTRLPVIVLLILCLMLLAQPVLGGDPTGAITLAENPDAPVNFSWTLLCGFLVMFMQAGFAMVETGLTRAKNAVNIMMKNLMDFSLGALAYWAVGFALMFGTSAGITSLIFGSTGFFLGGEAYDVSTLELWFFQMVFAATAATIVSGAMAERTKFSTYCIYSVVISALIYPIYGHWIWGGGWLNAADFMVALGGGYGALDFAGSGVVHALGGFVALAGALIVGPRLGKYRKDGTPVAIPGHSLTLAMLGVFILWFGWFGFNPGSTLAATELRISVIAVNTCLAAAAGAVTIMLLTWWRYGKPDASMTGNGVLGGLVAITAGCAWVSPYASVLIGVIAAIIIYLGVWFLDWKMHVDDPVGAVAVHGMNGIWGLLALGIFADGTYGVYTTEGPMVTGLLFGNAGFLAVQAISAVVVFIWAFGLGYILFRILKATIGVRVTEAEELEGLDIGEHGVAAYPNFVTTEPAIDGEKS
ncbi:Amt family ammonium transporter [Methanolinea mesophila]|uniref:ammonium transporter n=1 Tax=Methanolinea mesophila TaxID=547055 RepID=UPI001AE3191E|nr:ammonium transporter [Methanolinea mesophila]MBP1928290.1 Amt family ammonium transporter [Methanolinea mesophila]